MSDLVFNSKTQVTDYATLLPLTSDFQNKAATNKQKLKEQKTKEYTNPLEVTIIAGTTYIPCLNHTNALTPTQDKSFLKPVQVEPKTAELRNQSMGF